MAIIDIVKYEQQEREIVHKFPSCDLRWGSQLVVYPGQIAFFAKGGKLYDKFTEGTYTLKTKNVPLLNKIINLPFGGDSPFQADVWFVNLLTRLDLLWGTETPIQLEDPKYHIIVPVRAYGQYGFKISDASKFMSSLVGNMPSFDESKLQSYFRGILLSKLTNIIARKIIRDEISILEINTYIEDLSDFCKENLNPVFNEYGISVERFNIISINVPEKDDSLNSIKRAKNLKARLQITGTDVYRMERTFDVMDSAAKNEGNGGAFLNAGFGLGTGVTMGNVFSKEIASGMVQDALPSIPAETHYYLAVNGKQQGPSPFTYIIDSIRNNSITTDTLIWKKGMQNWQPISQMSEFNNIMEDEVPPIIPTF